MAGVLQYALSLKTAGFDNPLKKSEATLGQFRAPIENIKTQLGTLESSAQKTASKIFDVGEASRIAAPKMEIFSTETANSARLLRDLGVALQAVPGIAVMGGFAVTAGLGIAGFAGAVALSNAALRESGTDEAVAAIVKYDAATAAAKSQLTNLAAEFKKTALELVQPLTLKISEQGTQVINQLAKDLGFIREIAGLGDTSKAADPKFLARNAAANKAAADKLALDQAASAAARAVEESDAVFFEAKDQERAAFEKARAEQRVEIEKQAADRVRAAQEKVFEARLPEEANLQRKLAALRAVGPSGAGAINQTADPVVKSVIAERTAEIVTLEARLAEIKAGALVTDQAARKEAEGKLAVAAREAKAAGDAARLFAQEGAILEARANGQTKVVAALERQAKVEALKLELMEKQGLADTAAAAAAEKRVALEERAARPRRGLLDAAASFARRTAARSAADVTRDERLGRTGSNTDRLALADLQRRQNRPLSPAAAAAQLARGTGAADPGKNRREERAKAEEKAANPLLAVVKEIQEKLSNLATA